MTTVGGMAGQGRAVRLALDALRAGPLPTTSILPDGSTGHHMRRGDDCWAAAIATCLRAAYDEVPDAHIDAQLRRGVSAKRIDMLAEQDMREWLDRRDLTLVEHPTPPFHLARWIGVVTVPIAFKSHTLVMARDRILFDPAVQPGIRTYYSIEVDTGFSFRKKR
jgi:hypothetical protein